MPRTYGTTNAAPYASAPAVGAAGDTYFNTTSKTMFLSDGTQWIQVAAGGGGGGAAAAFIYAQATGVGGTAGNNVPITWGTVVNSSGFTTPPGVALSPVAAGRYEVSIQVSLTGTVATNYSQANIEHYTSGGALITTRQFVGVGFIASGYSQIDLAGVYDMGAGDYIRITVTAGQNFSVDARSTAQIVSASGATGPKGDTGATGPAGTPTSDGFTRVSAAGADIPLGASQVLPLPLATVVESAGSTYVANGGTTAFAVPAAGVYDMTGHISGNASGFTTGTIVALAVNGNIIARQTCEAVTAFSSLTISVQRYLNAGDQVGLIAIGNTATNIRWTATNSATDARQPYLSVWRSGVGLPGPTGSPGTSGSATAVPPPYFSARRSTAPLNNAGVYTQVALDTMIDSNTGTADYTLTGGAFTVVAAGYYQVVGQVSSSATASGAGIAIGYWTGTQWNLLATQAAAAASLPYNVTWEGWLAAGTQVALLIYAPSALTWGVNTTPGVNSPYNPSLSITKAGGAKGDPGAAGAAGAQGPAGNALTSLVARGEWTSAASYNPFEVVTRNGVAFLAMAANSNIDPSSLAVGSFAAIADMQSQISAIGKQIPWNPVIRQGGVVPTVTNAGWYSRMGEWVIGVVNVTTTGGGSAGQPVQMDLPVPIRASGGSAMAIGGCFMFVGSNTYPTLYTVAGNLTQTQFALGAAYVTTTMAANYNIDGYFMYLAPVGV